MRAAGPAGSAVVTPTTSTVAPLQGKRRLLLRGEEEAAAAAAGGGGCCCWGRRLLLLGEKSASSCCRWRFFAGVFPPAFRCGGSCPAGEWPSRCRPRSESVSPEAGCAARPVRRFVYTYSQCAVLGPGPGEAAFTLLVFFRTTPRAELCSLRQARRGYAAGRYVSVPIRTTTRAEPCSLRRARRGYAAGRYVSVPIRTTTRAEPCSLRRARRGYAAGRYVSVCQSESQRVPGSGRVSPAVCECAHRGQWPGPAMACAA